jgi:hypothetical protein
MLVQAFWRALNSVFGDKIQFKTTLKGASMLMNSAFRDLWVPGLCFVLLFATMIAGLIELFTGMLGAWHNACTAVMHMSKLTAAFAVLLMLCTQHRLLFVCTQTALNQTVRGFAVKGCWAVIVLCSLLQDDTFSAVIFATFASAYNCSPILCRTLL